MKGSTAFLPVLASAISAGPVLAQGDSSLDRLSQPLVTLECTVIGRDLRTGQLAMSFSGGQAFKLPGDDAEARLTKSTVDVRIDELALMNGAELESARFGENNGTVRFRSSPTSSFVVAIGSLATSYEDTERVQIDLIEAVDEGPALGSHLAAGVCDYVSKRQTALSSEDLSALVASSGGRSEDLIRRSEKAIPGPAAPSPPTPRSKPDREVETAQGVTQPLQVAECAVVSDGMSLGELRFTLSGGQGYERPSAHSTRTEIERTRRVMTIDSDSLGIFADKYPISELRKGLGPHDRFADTKGVRWTLEFGRPMTAANRLNANAEETLRFVLKPDRRQDRAALGSLEVQTYVGLCKFSSSAQEPLDQSEIMETLWQ